jgi:hypothetical protein
MSPSLGFYYGVFLVTTAYQLKRMMHDGVPWYTALPAAFVAGLFWPGTVAVMLTIKKPNDVTR